MTQVSINHCIDASVSFSFFQQISTPKNKNIISQCFIVKQSLDAEKPFSWEESFCSSTWFCCSFIKGHKKYYQKELSKKWFKKHFLKKWFKRPQAFVSFLHTVWRKLFIVFKEPPIAMTHGSWVYDFCVGAISSLGAVKWWNLDNLRERWVLNEGSAFCGTAIRVTRNWFPFWEGRRSSHKK